MSQIANNTVGLSYYKLRHFLVRANCLVDAVNERRLQVMWECRQTKPSRSFALIIDDSGLKKAFYFSILCLYIYYLASVNWRYKKALG